MALNITRGIERTSQKVIVYGPEGIGKTTFASKFPNPLFIDIEGGSGHLDVARVKVPGWLELMDTVSEVKFTAPCETLVIDSADWAEDMCAAYLCQKNKWESVASPGYGMGYAMLEKEFKTLLTMLDGVRDMGMNVVFTAHAAMRKFEQPDERAPYDRWEMKLQKKVAPKLKEWADAILFANYKTLVETSNNGNKAKARGAKRVMYANHHACWDAKNRWGLPDEVEFDYATIAAHIPSKQAEPATEETPDAAEETTTDGTEDYRPANLPDYWEPVLKLMKKDFVTFDEVKQVAYDKGHFEPGTPAKDFGRDYVEGFMLPNWKAFLGAIEILRDEIPF